MGLCLQKHIHLLKFLLDSLSSCSSESVLFLIISSRFPVELIWIKSCWRNRLQMPPLAASNFQDLQNFHFLVTSQNILYNSQPLKAAINFHFHQKISFPWGRNESQHWRETCIPEEKISLPIMGVFARTLVCHCDRAMEISK